MKRIFASSLALLFAAAGCESPTDENLSSHDVPTFAEVFAERGGEGQGAIFMDNFFVGTQVQDSETDQFCVGFLGEDLPLNDFIRQNRNGHWSFHIESHDARFFVWSSKVPWRAGELPSYSGEGRLKSSGTFTGNPLVDPGAELIETDVEQSGMVTSTSDGSLNHLVCKFQFVNGPTRVVGDVKVRPVR